jgi:hypothetical protein
MFNEQERNIIIMALMYLKNDYTQENTAALGFNPKGYIESYHHDFEVVVHNLMEDLAGPTWDEEETTENLKTETEKYTRSQ